MTVVLTLGGVLLGTIVGGALIYSWMSQALSDSRTIMESKIRRLEEENIKLKKENQRQRDWINSKQLESHITFGQF